MCQSAADTSFETKPSTGQETQRQANPVTLGARHWAGRAELLIMRAVAPVTVVPRKRRGVELALIIFALGLTLGAYALVDINVTGQLSSAFHASKSASVRAFSAMRER